MIGIYQIINIINGKYYVGSSIDIAKRISIHLHHLRTNKHHSILLQRAWNKYGEENFKFNIIEEVANQSELVKIEQKWIDASNCCNSKFGYNLHPIAGSSRGIKRTEKQIRAMSERLTGRIISEEWRQRISEGLRGNKSNRKSNEWPCELGVYCKCDDCRKKANKRRNDWKISKKKLVVIDNKTRII